MVQACQIPIIAGGEISQNDIVHDATNSPAELCCFADATCTSEQPDAIKVASTDSYHIELRFKNCALLCATVNGKKAYRTKFPNAFGEQLSKSDGKTNIYTMFTRATQALLNQQDEQLRKQVPEFRSTMSKALLL